MNHRGAMVTMDPAVPISPSEIGGGRDRGDDRDTMAAVAPGDGDHGNYGAGRGPAASAATVGPPEDQNPVRILCSAHSPVRLGRRLPASGPYLETTDAAEALAFFLRHYRDYHNCVIAVLDSPEDTRCRSSVTGSCDCPRCSDGAEKG